MAVYKDKGRGTWYCRISYRDDEGVKKNTTKRGFELKREAIKYEHEFRQSLKTSTHLTFQNIFDEYIKSLDTTPKTENDYKQKSKLFLTSLSQIKIDKIRPSKIQKIVNEIKKSGYSRKYKNESLRLLKATLTYSNNIHNTQIKTHMITSVPKTPEDIKEFNVWTNEEFDKFISKVDNKVYKAFFTFLFKTGARRGEVLALLWSDIKGNEVSINKSLTTHKEGLKSTKTLSSIRTILIDDETLKLIQSVKCGRFVFGGDTPLSTSQIWRVFEQAIKDSKVKRIRIHDLRHSHATILINNGANIVAVSKRLGHSDIGMTLKVYTHLLKKTEKELLNHL